MKGPTLRALLSSLLLSAVALNAQALRVYQTIDLDIPLSANADGADAIYATTIDINALISATTGTSVNVNSGEYFVGKGNFSVGYTATRDNQPQGLLTLAGTSQNTQLQNLTNRGANWFALSSPLILANNGVLDFSFVAQQGDFRIIGLEFTLGITRNNDWVKPEMAVPLPAAGFLFSSGLLALGGIGARRQWQRRFA